MITFLVTDDTSLISKVDKVSYYIVLAGGKFPSPFTKGKD